MLTIEQMKKRYPNVPEDLWNMFERLDAFTYNHSVRVCEMAIEVEEAMDLKTNELSEAALFHDIGKYYLSQKLLGKHAGLNEVERETIDIHPYLSYQVLKSFNLPKLVCDVALYHHSLEPEFLGVKVIQCADETVKKMAVIIKTIDIFEALTTDRPYRRGVTKEHAVKIMKMHECDDRVLEFLVMTTKFDR